MCSTHTTGIIVVHVAFKCLQICHLKLHYSLLPLNEYWAHLSPAVFKGHKVFFLKKIRPLQFRNMSIFAEQEFPIKMHASLFYNNLRRIVIKHTTCTTTIALSINSKQPKQSTINCRSSTLHIRVQAVEL